MFITLFTTSSSSSSSSSVKRILYSAFPPFILFCSGLVFVVSNKSRASCQLPVAAAARASQCQSDGVLILNSLRCLVDYSIKWHPLPPLHSPRFCSAMRSKGSKATVLKVGIGKSPHLCCADACVSASIFYALSYEIDSSI